MAFQSKYTGSQIESILENEGKNSSNYYYQ